MEIVDYDKTRNWEIMTIKNKDQLPQGFILKFIGESGKETRICCTPEELMVLKQGFEAVLKQEELPCQIKLEK